MLSGQSEVISKDMIHDILASQVQSQSQSSFVFLRLCTFQPSKSSTNVRPQQIPQQPIRLNTVNVPSNLQVKL